MLHVGNIAVCFIRGLTFLTLNTLAQYNISILDDSSVNEIIRTQYLPGGSF